jgi:hypothetical protein
MEKKLPIVECLKYIMARKNIYFSDEKSINEIFHFYGDNYHIPVFNEQYLN